MNRREMLRESVWNLAKLFPALPMITEGLRGWLQHKDGVIQCQRATCFPKGPQKPGACKGPNIYYEEE